jgi:geranylgeranyl pyrophosphate synthase
VVAFRLRKHLLEFLVRLGEVTSSARQNVVISEGLLTTASFDSRNRAGKTVGGIPKRPNQQRNAHRERFCDGIPGEGDLAELLGLDDRSPIEDILRSALLDLIAELASSPGKGIRGQLVSLSYRLLSGTPPSTVAAKQCRWCADAVEMIHAGSLIIDDIEDGSCMRRGRPALHVQFGVPLALNAGNWLYFWGLELLRMTELPEDTIFHLYEHCHRTLLRAHFGQAVDLSARIATLPQCRVAAACLASMKLKTGALMGFAMILGGSIAGASEWVLPILDDFGREFGVALQMFNDLGNLIGNCEPSKRYEDLKLYRPSWVWACAAETTPKHYQQFCTAVARLPDADDLEIWIGEHNLVQQVRATADHHLDAAFRRLEKRLIHNGVPSSPSVFDELRRLADEITIAYG